MLFTNSPSNFVTNGGEKRFSQSHKLHFILFIVIQWEIVMGYEPLLHGKFRTKVKMRQSYAFGIPFLNDSVSIIAFDRTRLCQINVYIVRNKCFFHLLLTPLHSALFVYVYYKCLLF